MLGNVSHSWLSVHSGFNLALMACMVAQSADASYPHLPEIHSRVFSGPHHGVGFSRACLPVSDDANIVAVRTRRYGGLGILKHLLLLRLRVVHSLKLEDFLPSLRSFADDSVFAVKFQTTPTTAVVAAATEDANVAS